LILTIATAAREAFSAPWLGNSHRLLTDSLDQLRIPPTNPLMGPYNHSIEIIQSSGFGKSRIADETADIKFCFPFNIREPQTGQLGKLPSVFGDLLFRDYGFL
jgi:hypothetical protein